MVSIDMSLRLQLIRLIKQSVLYFLQITVVEFASNGDLDNDLF